MRRSCAAQRGGAGRRPGSRRGFTLLEVLLSLGLIIVLIGAMTGFMAEVVDRRTTLARGSRDIEAAGAFIDRLEADLLAGLAGGPGLGAGVQGTGTTLRVLTRGVHLPTGSDVDAGDLQGSEFVFEPASPRLMARRIAGVGTTDGGEAGSYEMLSDRFERVRFRYCDGREWREEFDSLREGRLPAAIEVCVWITSIGRAAAPVRGAGRGAEGSAEAGRVGGGGEGDDLAASSSRAKEASAARERSAAESAPFAWGEPDRRRVIVVPDGPEAEWSAAR